MSLEREDRDERSTTSRCVYLVGAGPGDPELITVRGLQLLQRADVIIYDRLAAAELLAQARPDAELIFVGKAAGNHALPQEKINALLIEKAQPGKIVVRLKGGDPLVFGRGAEEAQVLHKADIKFEIVPGVTAAVAAGAYAGIPLTHRDCASEVAFITGHEQEPAPGKKSTIDWKSLAHWQGTLAFYMGVSNLTDIAQKLIHHGMHDHTPAAAIASATTTAQKTLIGTIGSLPAMAERAQLKPPALIIVGKVVKYRQELAWFEDRPLWGKTIVVTRARAQASTMVDQLKHLGAQVIECPSIRIEPPENDAPMIEALGHIAEYQWIVFTSVNGVDSFLGTAWKQGHDSRLFCSTKLCAIGPATAERMERYGLKPDLVPPRYMTDSIVQALTEQHELQGQRILLPRADIAPDTLTKGLQQAGALVDEIIAYRTVCETDLGPAVQEALAEDRIDWITFASSSTVTNFFQSVPIESLKKTRCRLASIGPVTSKTLEKHGLEPDVEAEHFDIDHLIAAIMKADSPRT